MNKAGRSKIQEQTGLRPRYLPLRELAREALWDTMMLSGLAFVEEELEAERTALCGPRLRACRRAPGNAGGTCGELAHSGRPPCRS